MDELIEEDQRRLDALEARIVQLERRVEERERGGPGPKYFESGSVHPEMDDQAITP